MGRSTTGDASARRIALQHNTLRTLVFTSLCATLSTTNCSASPMTMFAPPSHILPQRRFSQLQRGSQMSNRNNNPNVYTKQYLATNDMTAVEITSHRSMSKIKSPSNSYTQFYKEGVLVGIERTSSNSRRISGEIIIEGIPIDAIWNILTDYDNLSVHVPNLVESKVINNVSRITGGRPRVYQQGAQRIFGFEFGADVTMDMAEYAHRGQNDNDAKKFSVDFECVDSQFFSQFDGSWILEEYSNNKTMVRYIVDVRPKGPVPVAALEWRIKEDVPVNILAVSNSARASAAVHRAEDQRLPSRLESEKPLGTNQLTMDRAQQSSPTPPPRPNPLQQLTNQAAQNLKRTAKTFLPTPVYSSARQAIKVMNKSNGIVRAQGSRWTNAMPSMSLDRTGQKKISLDETIVDWYEDETMATYLKDS